MRLSPIRTTPSRSLPRHISLALCLATLPAIFPVTPTHASDWINSSGAGGFSVPGNWSAGVPGPGQLANFNLATTCLVSFVGDVSNGSLTLSAGIFTFRTTGASPLTYALSTGASITGGSLTLGPGSSSQPLTLNTGPLSVSTANLSVTSGNLLSATTVNLATLGTGTANLTVDNATFNAFGTLTMGQNGGVANVTFQNNAVGLFSDISMTNSSFATSGAHVTIQSGASVSSFGSLLIGPGIVAGQSSTILVDGTASSFTQTGSANLTLGSSANSTASITIINGGTFTTSTGTTTINATGTLAITNGTFNANGNLTLDHGTLTYNSGNFNLANGKTLTAQNAANVNFNTAYNIPGGRTVLIQSGAHFNASNYVDLNDNGGAGTATLIVDGSGSSFTTTNDPWIGANGGSGVLTIRNNATASIASSLDIAVTAISGTSGTVNVQSGGKLTVAGDINLAAQGATGLIHITDGTLIQTSGLMTLGDSTGPSAVLTIDNATGAGGTFTSSTSGITVNKSGTVNLNAGTLNANGDVTLNGGTFNSTPSGTFNLAAGKNLTATANATVAFSNYFNIGNGSTVTISDSSHLSSTINSFEVGSGSAGTLIVDGTASTFSAAADSSWGSHAGSAIVTFRNGASASFINAAAVYIGSSIAPNSSAIVTVQSGATFSLASLYIGTNNAGKGTLTLSDPTSSITQTSGSLTIGYVSGGSGNLIINDGIFSSAAGTITVNKTGTITLNAGTFNANGNILLDGGAFNFTGGNFNLFTNRNLTAQNGATVNFIAYNIPGSSTFTIQSGAHLSDSNYLDIGNATGPNPATLIVDGTGSSFTTTNGPWIGASGGVGVLTIRNNATASINSRVDVAVNTAAGTSGTVNVQSGGKLTVAGDITVASAGGGATGLIHLTDGTLTQTSGVLTLGDSTGTSAVLTIDSLGAGGGTFISSSSGIAINKSGTININDSTLNAFGDISLDGGALYNNGGALNIFNGKNLTAAHNATVSFTGYFLINGGSAFIINSGSHLSSSSSFDVGVITNPNLATLILDGSGSSFTITGTSTWGALGGSAIVTIRNNATASIASQLGIAANTLSGTAGTVNVQSGAQLTIAGNIRLAADGGNAVGLIHLTDGTLTQTAGGITVGNPTGTGTATLTIDNATGSGGTFSAATDTIAVNKNAAVNILAGTLNANGPINNTGAITVGSGGTTGSLNGTVTLANNGTITLSHSNPYSLNTPISGTGLLRHIGTGTTTLTAPYSATGPISLTAGKLIFAATTASRHTPAVLLAPSSLTLSASTTLDATNHDLMLGNSSFFTIQAQILKGFNKSNATDRAITSSTALANPNTFFLVPIDADALLGTGSPHSAIGYNFDGTAITQPNTILVKYAYIGDVTLDGKIDGLDFATAAGHFGQSSPGLTNIQNAWLMGDVNLDGFVNTTDFNIMSTNAPASQLSPLGALNLTPVPEPSSLALLALALPALLTRRKPRHRHSHLTT